MTTPHTSFFFLDSLMLSLPKHIQRMKSHCLPLSLSTFGPVLHHIMTSLSDHHLLLLLGKLSRKVWYYKNIPTSSQHGLRTLKPEDTYKQFRLLYKNTLLLYNLWLRPMYCCDWCNIFKWLMYQQIDFFPFSYQRKTNSLKRQEHSTLALKKNKITMKYYFTNNLKTPIYYNK